MTKRFSTSTYLMLGLLYYLAGLLLIFWSADYITEMWQLSLACLGIAITMTGAWNCFTAACRR